MYFWICWNFNSFFGKWVSNKTNKTVWQISNQAKFYYHFSCLVTGALSGDLGDLGAHGTGTANALGLGGTAIGGGLNGLGAGAWGVKGSGGGAMTGALLGTAGQTGIGGLAGSSSVGGQTGTVGGLSEIHASGGAYGLG